MNGAARTRNQACIVAGVETKPDKSSHKYDGVDFDSCNHEHPSPDGDGSQRFPERTLAESQSVFRLMQIPGH